MFPITRGIAMRMFNHRYCFDDYDSLESIFLWELFEKISNYERK